MDSLELTLLDVDTIVPGSTLATRITDGVKLNIDESMIVSAKDGIDVADKTGNSLLTNTQLTNREITLSVPLGGEYYIELQDGTKVWLGSESELLFPEHFTEDKRMIAIKGEAYLEVAHNSKKPFYVDLGDVNIHVTGTAFIPKYQLQKCCTFVCLPSTFRYCSCFRRWS